MVGVSESRQSRATLQAVAATLVLCLLAACSATTHIAYDPRNGDGLGGTGITHAQNSSENGDGIGGTGVVGTISGFGSIIVNGLQLEFDPKTIVETDGKPTSLEALI